MSMMLRTLFLAAAPLALAGAALSAAPAAAAQGDNQRCEEQNRDTAGRRLRRGILGGIGRAALGRAGVPGSVAGAYLPVGELLDEAIASLLDCREQQQAATATNEAIRGGVGTTSEWQSESRPNVSGRSTVTAAETGGGDDCMTVSDIVIVDGQETRASKRMCRRPPNNRYVRV